MKDDLIKRSEAEKAVCAGCLTENGVCTHHWNCPMLTNLVKLSSTDRPRGEWIGGEIPNKCSVCGHNWDEYVEGQEIWYVGSVPNFCPNCGVKMKGLNDE